MSELKEREPGTAVPEGEFDDGSPGAWADLAFARAIGALGGALSEAGPVELESFERDTLRRARVVLVRLVNRLRAKYLLEPITTTWYAAECRALKVEGHDATG